MQLKSKTLGLTALAILASAGQALAVTFSGTTTGIFDNAAGDPGMVTTGQGTDTFTWGANGRGAPPPPNSLNFLGSSFGPVALGDTFPIGTITYFNGQTLPGTNATSVELLVDVAFSSPVGDIDLDYVLGLISTPNSSDPDASADFVSLPAVAPQTFWVGSTKYKVSVSFDGDNEFKVRENETASTQLVGVITEVKVPESGSSLALLGGGMLLISGLRRKLKATK